MRIGIDLMGSDSSPAQLFEAIEQAMQQFPAIHFVVFLTQAALDAILQRPSSSERAQKASLEFHVVTEVIEMQEEPVIAIRQKKNSSLALGLKFLKKRYLDGFVTAGNTGALIAGATLSLSLLPGIKRPALLAILPTEKRDVVVIDVGGNVTCKAHHLVQFAEMGAAYQSCFHGIDQPKVGLLNIGIESKKGTSELRQAYLLLQAKAAEEKMQFIGNIEGRSVFRGITDVLVTDGFTGNVLLKTSEGVSFFILQQLQEALKDISLEQRENILRCLHYEFDCEEYSGAIVCGIDCIAVKCHGHSSSKGMLNSIRGAIQLAQNNFIPYMKKYFTNKYSSL